MTRPIIVTLVALLALGCKRQPPGNGQGESNDPTNSQQPVPTNRVDIPAAVRRNLGITFAKVERRKVGRTLRIPGRFELIPTARREYLAIADGRVELMVSQYQAVGAGAVLYRLESARWRELQEQLNAAQAGILQAQARTESMGPLRAAHGEHRKSLEEKVALWSERLKQLEAIRQAGGGQQSAFTEARGALKDAQAELADVIEQTAELAARKLEVEAELQAARSRFELLLDTAAALTAIPATDLQQAAGSRPLWHSLNAIEVKSIAPAVVGSIGAASGALVKEGTMVVVTIQPDLIRFHGRALQADLGQLRNGLPARIVAPRGAGADTVSAIAATLSLGLVADPDNRTIEVIATPDTPSDWARAGVSAHLEVMLEGGSIELAVPQSCIARDGARPIVFRRDPADPDTVIRMDADIGASDGSWMVLNSGVKEGDEIVLDGVYQLMLATAGNTARGGHFHSDGTFHEGEDK